MNRIELARQYVEEMIAQRGDIVAAWIGGSVARGEETELSDIDLSLMVAATGAMSREGFDLWREGIYIEAGIISQQEFADLEAVLNNPFRATHMNDALILYDPTGFVKQMQDAVRAVYMQPQWLNKRLSFWLERLRTNLAQFKESVTARDALRICAALGRFTYSCSSIPLLRAGITPSSTRSLLLLAPVAPVLKAQLAEFEGSTQMDVGDVLALEPLLREAMPYCAASYGQLPLYFVPKALWMARQGHYQEALHTMWLYMGAGAAGGCLDRNDSSQLLAGADLMQRWLHQFGMDRPEVLATKVESAELLLRELEGLVSEI
jgi:hypothetical protein